MNLILTGMTAMPDPPLESRNSHAIVGRAASGEHETWLDELSPESIRVGYGQAGFKGQLGYESRPVEICGERMPHAISAHAPSRLVYSLGGKFQAFRCRVGLNDSAPVGTTHAEFYIVADGQIAGVARRVRSGQMPRLITADLRGVQQLELVIQTQRWEWCHAVWVDPVLTRLSPDSGPRVVIDGLRRAEIVVPSELPSSELCIATVGSQGFESWIDDLFGSICANAQCPGASLAIFSLRDSPEIRRVAEKYGAIVIPCRPLRPLNAASKSVLYAAGHVIPAKKFICLDADMLVLDDLRPIAAMIDAVPSGSILACREAQAKLTRDLEQAVNTLYGGHSDDISLLSGDESPAGYRYSFVVNDGLFAGSRTALCAVDNQICCMNQPARWVDDPAANIPWRNQFIFNLALAQADCGVELDGRYNVQLHAQRAEFFRGASGIGAWTDGLAARVIHFNGWGRGKVSEWRGRYRGISRPAVRTSCHSQAYRQFVAALNKWVGHLGVDALAWSFYGTADSQSARVTDTSTFPLFMALHSLIRANGCIRVVETGTARGVSAACLASAVAHRPGATVVTLDIEMKPEREMLWSMLPASLRECIVPRQNDAIAGLEAALSDGETYHAALLDSVHAKDHVLKEFELARQLVCEGGLILIHDAILPCGTVCEALDVIQRQGYGVARLWTATEGEREDDSLGLAVIENRKRTLS